MPLLQDIQNFLLDRTRLGLATTFRKVRAHAGVPNNEAPLTLAPPPSWGTCMLPNHPATCQPFSRGPYSSETSCKKFTRPCPTLKCRQQCHSPLRRGLQFWRLLLATATKNQCSFQCTGKQSHVAFPTLQVQRHSHCSERPLWFPLDSTQGTHHGQALCHRSGYHHQWLMPLVPGPT